MENLVKQEGLVLRFKGQQMLLLFLSRFCNKMNQILTNYCHNKRNVTHFHILESVKAYPRENGACTIAQTVDAIQNFPLLTIGPVNFDFKG